MNEDKKPSENEEMDTELKADEEKNVDEKEAEEQDIEEGAPMSSRRKFLILAASAVVAAPLGVGAGYLLKTQNDTREAKKTLSKIVQQQGAITPINTKLTAFGGRTLENVNIEQKSLTGGENNTSDTAAVFIFGNASKTEKKIIDAYIDFDSQRSRDFVLINQTVFKNMVESGSAELRIHPVSSGSALSIYSPEAIAECFVTAPAKAWDLVLSLLKLSAELQSDGDVEILPALIEKVEELNIPKIDEETIKNGTFSSWIIAVGNDPKLSTDYYPPIVYVNDIVMDPNKVDFNNANTVQDFILNV